MTNLQRVIIQHLLDNDYTLDWQEGQEAPAMLGINGIIIVYFNVDVEMWVDAVGPRSQLACLSPSDPKLLEKLIKVIERAEREQRAKIQELLCANPYLLDRE